MMTELLCAAFYALSDRYQIGVDEDTDSLAKIIATRMHEGQSDENDAHILNTHSDLKQRVYKILREKDPSRYRTLFSCFHDLEINIYLIHQPSIDNIALTLARKHVDDGTSPEESYMYQVPGLKDRVQEHYGDFMEDYLS